MRKVILMLVLALSLSACTANNQHGMCVGLAETKKPELNYEVSWWNVVVAFVFSETGVVPLMTAGWYLYCPTGKR